MRVIYNRVWLAGVAIATLFSILPSLTACHQVRDLSHDPDVVDSVTMAYIVTELKDDLLATDSSIVAVERITPTRQDYIPIAVVSVEYRNGQRDRQAIGFDYRQISLARDLMEQYEGLSVTAIADSLSTSISYATMLQKIVLRSKAVR